MKLNVQRTTLLSLLEEVKGVAKHNKVMPILGHVLLSADGGKLTAKATDQSTAIAASREISGEGGLDIAVPCGKLYDVVKACVGDTVTLDGSSGSRMVVKCGGARFTLLALPALDFHAFPAVPDGKLFVMPAAFVRKIMEEVIFSASQDGTRINLCGVNISASNGVLSACATDGHRLALATMDYAGECDSVTIPTDGMRAIAKAVGDHEGEVHLAMSDSLVAVDIGDTTISVRLHAGEFPDVRQVIPKESSHVVEIAPDMLREVLVRVGTVGERTSGAKLEFLRGTLTLSTSSPDSGEASETIDIADTSIDMKLGVNSRYVIEALTACGKNDSVRLCLTDGERPMKIEADGLLHVIMPMRL